MNAQEPFIDHLYCCGLLLSYLGFNAGDTLPALFPAIHHQATPHDFVAHQPACGMYALLDQPINALLGHVALLKRHQSPLGPSAAIIPYLLALNFPLAPLQATRSTQSSSSADVAYDVHLSPFERPCIEPLNHYTNCRWLLRASATTFSRPGRCLTSTVYSYLKYM